VRLYYETIADDICYQEFWSGWWDGEGFFPTQPPLSEVEDYNFRHGLQHGRPTKLLADDVLYVADWPPTARELLGLPEGNLSREDVQLAATLATQRLSQAVAEVLAECPPDSMRQNDLLDAAFA
jgi:hypothetical protein